MVKSRKTEYLNIYTVHYENGKTGTLYEMKNGYRWWPPKATVPVEHAKHPSVESCIEEFLICDGGLDVAKITIKNPTLGIEQVAWSRKS